jgi:hypothetical protein
MKLDNRILGMNIFFLFNFRHLYYNLLVSIKTEKNPNDFASMYRKRRKKYEDDICEINYYINDSDKKSQSLRFGMYVFSILEKQCFCSFLILICDK